MNKALTKKLSSNFVIILNRVKVKPHLKVPRKWEDYCSLIKNKYKMPIKTRKINISDLTRYTLIKI